jgi:sucrose-phosphate synthase
VPAFKVVPPGIDIEKFYPFYHDLLEENERSENARYAQARILKELNRFFMQPDKPLILSLCRPDKRKNISGLIQAYGEDLELQTMANLAVFAGIRKDIDDMQDNERDVLTQMLLLMDKYDLYGKLAIPKRHDFEYEVPVLYRVAAEKRGVFINPALTEPFGLTLLEASATGLPIVATNDGGPNDIVRNCENGILIDPTRPKEISNAVRKIIANSQLWEQYSKSGIMKVREHYTWASHAETYAAEIGRLMGDNHASDMDTAVPSDAIGRRLIALDHLLITDIDNTLIGEDNGRLEALLAILERTKQRIGFGVATGRTIDATVRILARHHVPPPDVIISSVGSEIYYGADHQFAQGWATHIAHQWQRDKIIELSEGFRLSHLPGGATQREFKISYFMDPGKERLTKDPQPPVAPQVPLQPDLLPRPVPGYPALPGFQGQGDPLFELQVGNSAGPFFLVCGDSGNDEEMLRGEPRGVVVGNYHRELEPLRESRHVYFAKRLAPEAS